MIPGRFLYIINAFKKDDFKLLGKFLNSPFHNSNKNVVRLYQYLKRIYPNFETHKFSLEILHKKIFPGKIYNEKIIRNLIYEFCYNAEKYFSNVNFSENVFDGQKHLLLELNKRKLDRLVKDSIKDADGIIADRKIKDDEYYKGKMFIEQIRYYYEINEVPMGKSLVLSNIKKEYINNATNHFMLIMLKEYFEKKNWDVHIKSNIEFELWEHLQKYLDTAIENYKDEPVIYLLYKFIKLSENTSADDYFLLKELTISNKNNISHIYFKDFILELYNYCKSQERIGNMEFGHESFELIKYMIDNNLLIEDDGMLLEHNYTNTVATAIRLKEVDWALNFINKFKNKMPVKIRENAYCYNMASVLYVTSSLPGNDKKMFHLENALDLLSKVKTTDFYYTTRVNNLQLFIFFEKKDFEPMFNLIDAYRHFLHTNKLIPDALKMRYSNFINFMNRLIRIKSGSEHTSLDKLKSDILKTETEYKKWLLNQIEIMKDTCNK